MNTARYKDRLRRTALRAAAERPMGSRRRGLASLVASCGRAHRMTEHKSRIHKPEHAAEKIAPIHLIARFLRALFDLILLLSIVF